MPLDETTSFNDHLTPTSDEMVQLHHNVLESIKDLPHQSEIDFSNFAKRDVLNDIITTDIGIPIKDLQFPDWGKRFLTLESLLACTEDWADIFEGEQVSYYNLICLMYGFRPDIPKSAFDPKEAEFTNNRKTPDKELDTRELDEKLTNTLLQPIPYNDLSLDDETRKLFEDGGFQHIGDLMMYPFSSFKRKGITSAALTNLKNRIKEMYGIDRYYLAANNTTRQAVRFKYFAMKSIQKFSDGGPTE